MLIVTAILAVMGLATAGTIVHLGTQNDLKDSQAQLTSTRGNLASTQRELEDTTTELQSTADNLNSVTHERNELRGELRRTRADLRGVRGSLAESQATVELQAGQIESLKICLDGVAEALDYVIYELYNAAINALTRVEGECQVAFSLF